VFFIQQLEGVLKQAAAIPNRMHLQRVQVIDNGSGESLAGLVNAYPEMVRQFLARLDETLGLNMVGILSQAGLNSGAGHPANSPAVMPGASPTSTPNLPQTRMPGTAESPTQGDTL
jgi:uncharacterized membrane protein YqiK